MDGAQNNMIKIGDSLPEASFMTPGADGPEPVTSASLFRGKKAVLIGMPGAFTGTCSGSHLPGFLSHIGALKEKGVELVACVTVNDVFVVGAWAEHSKVDGKIVMLADGSAVFTKAIGLELDLTERGFGVRSQRYAMILQDGVVKELLLEDTPATADASGAEAVLAKL